jgi:hypothetical protein
VCVCVSVRGGDRKTKRRVRYREGGRGERKTKRRGRDRV